MENCFSWVAGPHPFHPDDVYLIEGKLRWRDRDGYARVTEAFRHVAKSEYEKHPKPGTLILTKCREIEAILCRVLCLQGYEMAALVGMTSDDQT